jgi:Fe-S cluster assembly protein SufD
VHSGVAAWARAAHEDAAGRLRAMGLPGRRDEYWRFTDPDHAERARADARAAVFADGEVPVFDGSRPAQDRLRRRRLRCRGVGPARGEGIEIERLSDAMRRDIHWARDVFGVLEARGQVPVARPFAALNTATATDGVVIRATGKVARPVHLVYLHRSETSDATLHHVVKVEKGADLTLLETGPPPRASTR